MAARILSLLLTICIIASACSAQQAPEQAIATNTADTSSSSELSEEAAQPAETQNPSNAVEEAVDTSDTLDCAALELTDAECLNAGTHNYSMETVLTFGEDGSCFPADPGTETITFEFFGQGRLTQIRNGTAIDMAHTAEESTYVFFYENNQRTWVTEMTFNIDGFTEEIQTIGSEDQKVYCVFEKQYERLD